MFTPPSSPLPSPGKERNPMDDAGASLLGPGLSRREKEETEAEIDSESAESQELLESVREWEQRQLKKRRRARIRTITATLVVPIVTLAIFLLRARHSFWSSNVSSNDTSEATPMPISHRLDTHNPHSPLNHVPRAALGINGANSTPTATPVTGQALPTVPATPPTLPTPFPQPFDSDFGQNFSSANCYDFLMNMTNTQPFRRCRPFGMLLSGSNSFLEASESLQTLNSVVWGTCNTNTPYSECISNINWFANGLQSACSKELSDQQPRVLSVLGALQSYPLYHKLGCIIDPASNTYCYLNAMHNSNPSDIYIYGLGLGTQFPSKGKANPSCSACSRQVLGVYSGALANGTGSDKALLGQTALTNLKRSYPPAADIWSESCGSGFATAIAGGAIANLPGIVPVVIATLVTMIMIS